jgi:hypothetical protein
MVEVQAIDCVEEFATFFDQTDAQAAVILLLIPGAPIGPSEAGNCFSESIHGTHTGH